ncbi:uncharacterized protein LOC133878157 [Alnus glutinosa]|uniref:uncharacterized protein LOC133878157 n=1 Tax=Alnus glutinosa TaxID=3517 RepID=UPI002D79679E|nr:uncharacterized protein LOC133878157 [Alnus glutinosa]
MATSMANSSKVISLKLLVDKSSNKVLFAEAGKEFVDFLFGLLQIPLGSIMGLLWNHGIAGSAGSLSRIYGSVQNLDPTYLLQTKDALLKPKPVFPPNTLTPPLLLNFVPPKPETGVKNLSPFGFPAFSSSVVISSPSGGQFEIPASSSAPGYNPVVEQKETGYVRGVVTYMVMDDLTVEPMSTISSITLLNTFNVKDVSFLREKMVNVDIKKGLEMVKASFGSTTVLTDVFLEEVMICLAT